MHVSQRYLDLTKQKLELTRLPREPQSSRPIPDIGVTKSQLEPLIDHWLEEYDWRRQETYINEHLPQFRALISGVRLHFVHRRSQRPHAIPLLFIHGFPESFLSAERVIDALCDPIDEHRPAFHLIVPSIPGFGLSDPVPEEGNSVPTTAALFDTLMKSLGYGRYMVHGSGWAFNICRMLALAHQESCLAIHTVNPEVPAPRSPPAEGLQTMAYALCDSPPGLLAYILDAIRPLPPTSSTPTSPASSHSQAMSTDEPESWSPTAILNWTMVYWLSGPEVALRWVANSAALAASLWLNHVNVPLGITQFSTPVAPLQWAEAYHRLALLRHRPGTVRFPAWERPGQVVEDIRELAAVIGAFV
ncbi:alpha/beta-hydrolase [Piedraia hortae CBS 480.64]|uniref:Alpha/beta-hydrolase n=1 Tax=Piedraia hortae CBS 480.64 TaxID=1314780 RepID=A0A6A7CAV5_9PEZI|nr:alpha/beta-hydrolase [Piedraia hortae CBS 480.64]